MLPMVVTIAGLLVFLSIAIIALAAFIGKILSIIF